MIDIVIIGIVMCGLVWIFIDTLAWSREVSFKKSQFNAMKIESLKSANRRFNDGKEYHLPYSDNAAEHTRQAGTLSKCGRILYLSKPPIGDVVCTGVGAHSVDVVVPNNILRQCRLAWGHGRIIKDIEGDDLITNGSFDTSKHWAKEQ